ASRALRRHGGFQITAALLQISPEIFFSGDGSSTTVFAIHDAALSGISIPPRELRRLLRYHTAVSGAFPAAELAGKPPGFRLATLAGNESLVVTGRDRETGAVTINRMSVSHPDMFLQDRQLSIHGIAAPFPPPLPDSGDISDRGIIPWDGIIGNLSSKGFSSFAAGLNRALEGILEGHKNLKSVTVFAPPNSESMFSTSQRLPPATVAGIHILPRRFSSRQLLNLRNTSVTTLAPGRSLKIRRFSRTLRINSVRVTAPDLVSHETFVIHGISGSF
ncbi:hypothetical protein M569_05717, partial [Genlisea aurea]